MKRSRIEHTIIKIFEDYEEGELPDDLEEWFSKYLPKRKRKNVPDNNRCNANTHKRERCTKKIFKNGSDCLCYQHYKIYTKDEILPFGFFKISKI